ncbi:hypothetical protein YPPY76_2741 [Yersinia pestis PY-76]|nr:hypothetical protein YPPY76_2741 [Yersinia pestis PY-76]
MARTLYFFCLSSPFKIASSGFVSSLNHIKYEGGLIIANKPSYKA